MKNQKIYGTYNINGFKIEFVFTKKAGNDEFYGWRQYCSLHYYLVISKNNKLISLFDLGRRIRQDLTVVSDDGITFFENNYLYYYNAVVNKFSKQKIEYPRQTTLVPRKLETEKFDEGFVIKTEWEISLRSTQEWTNWLGDSFIAKYPNWFGSGNSHYFGINIFYIYIEGNVIANETQLIWHKTNRDKTVEKILVG